MLKLRDNDAFASDKTGKWYWIWSMQRNLYILRMFTLFSSGFFPTCFSMHNFIELAEAMTRKKWFPLAGSG